MTTNTPKTPFEFTHDDLGFAVAAFTQTAHYAKESRDADAKTAEDKAHDQRIIDKAHDAVGKLLDAALEANGPAYAMYLYMEANELWDGLVGEQAGTDKETAETTAA